jgi:dUTPase
MALIDKINDLATRIAAEVKAKLDRSEVSTFGLSLINDLDAPSARTTLGLGGLATKSTVASADIDAHAVTNTVLRDSAALSVIGRAANSIGDPADIAAGTDGHILRRSGTTLGFGTLATAGVADAAITYAKMQTVAALSTPGRASNSTGVLADIVASADGQVLRRSGTTLGFGTVVTAGIADNAVANAKLADMAASTIKGNNGGASADPIDLTVAQVMTMLGFASSKAAAGYQQLPGGVILQWGSRSSPDGSNQTVTFPIAFPVACQLFLPVAIANAAGTQLVAVFAGSAATTTGCSLQYRYATNGGAVGVLATSAYWFAVGY